MNPSARAIAAKSATVTCLPVLLTLASTALPAAAQSPIEEAMRYTVKVVTVIDHPFGYEHKGRSSGSGFLVDRERGWILTNAHVAARSPSRIRVSFRNGDPITATKLHVDALVDLAVLSIPPTSIPSTATEAKIDCGGEAVLGHAVIAFGHPWNLDFTATRGIISSIRSTLGIEKLQTDAALNAGNSGGPLISEATGQVIGVNFAGMVSRSTSAAGLNLAVPARYACTILGLLRAGRDASAPRLPVEFAETSKDRELVVASVSAPWEGSLRVGDRVLAVNDDEDARYASRVADIARGASELRLLVKRGETELETVLPVPEARRHVVLRGLAVSGMLIAYGPQYWLPEKQLAVHHVDEASDAEEAELRSTDEVVAVAGSAVTSLEDLRPLLEASRGESVEVIVRRRSDRNEPSLRALRLKVGTVEMIGK
jgi:serine protease Do